MSQSFPASQVGIWPRKNHLGTQHSVGLSTWCKHLILGPKLYSSHHSPLWRYSVCLSGPAFVKEKEKKGGAHCERFWIPESGKFSAVESGIWENFACGIQIPGIWNPEDQRIRNSTNDWNSESTFHWQRLESAIHGLEFSIYACLLGLIPFNAWSEKFYCAKLIVLTFTIFCQSELSRILHWFHVPVVQSDLRQSTNSAK